MSGSAAHRRSARRGWLVVLFLVAALAGVTACSSDKPSATSGSSGSPRPAVPPLSTAIPTLPSTPPATAAELARFIGNGLAATGFARIDFTTALSGNSLAGGGQVQLEGGEVSGLDVRATVSEVGDVHYLLVDNVPYAALPTPTRPGKPYVVLGATAGGKELDRTAIGLQATKLLASPATYRTLVAASDNLTLVGRQAVGATPALHYHGAVTVSKISSDDAVRVALGVLDVSNLDLDLWVDGAGRPLKASAPAPDGRNSDVTFTEINRRFTLARPPADQVDK